MARDEQLQLLALCALEGVTGSQWETVAREASRPGGLREMLSGHVSEQGSTAQKLRRNLADQLHRVDDAVDNVADQVATAEAAGASLVTVLDDDYPLNLRRIHNQPPFLFVLGALRADEDATSIAVVGTRRATPRGLKQARRMARLLTEQGITVASGLAAGIDTAAHEATLDAGGRTVAVMGTGILRTYPKENAELRERIGERGAVISQFWPDQPPGRHTFPIRNVVTSGITQGTVVIEASHTSGARQQARKAWEHGKEVFLLQSLVTSEDWAKMFVEKGRAIEISSVDEIAARLQAAEELREGTDLRQQLAFELA